MEFERKVKINMSDKPIPTEDMIITEMEDIIKRGYKCKRCGHGWEPRAFAQSLEIPTTCPRCKSPYWNKERRSKK
jgi:predicted Zn-ribbon and HTH transcriptional regulator